MSDEKETFGGELAKKLPIDKIYEDAIQPLAQATGATIAMPIEALNAALSEVKKWINEKNYSVKLQEALYERLLRQLQDVTPEKIITPDRFIVVPLLRDMNYAIDSEIICQLYASLLATNMNSDTKNMAHPSFIQIIEQLSPLDAKAIDIVGFLKTYQPLIRIFACEEKPIQDERMADFDMPEFGDAKKKIPLFSHYSLPIKGLETTAEERGFIIQNLNRLGLINIDYREHIIDAEQYKPLYNELLGSTLYHSFMEETEQKGLNLQLTDGYTSPTDFGRLFFSACCRKTL
ncbi:MAG: DUF4393 domain-containing protein [Lachnospiraceae bacterium]|nr:DUF4393 domain-containing protein [Lachnospiraceae bacterium]